MRIVLRSKENGLYVGQTKEWTGKVEAARDFDSITEAEKFCHEHDMNVVAVVKLRDMTYELQLNCAASKKR